MKVFISYANRDAALAGQLAQALEEEGLQVWDAQREGSIAGRKLGG
jgi:hypothetical protein